MFPQIGLWGILFLWGFCVFSVFCGGKSSECWRFAGGDHEVASVFRVFRIGFLDAARIAGLLSGENRLRAILQLQVEGGDNSFEFGGGHFVEEGESNKAGAEIFGVAKSERADELLSEG